MDDGLKALAQSSPAGLAYVDHLDPESGESSYDFPQHIDLLNREIRALCLGDPKYEEYKGIIFSVPPRHGKSYEVSQYTPAWFLGTFPEKTCAVCSYEADFAMSWGKKAREVLETHGPEVFGVEVDPSNRAGSYWRVRKLRRGRPIYGSMITAGIGGPLTGRGVHLMIVDDPVKNALEAHSKTKRQGVWDWWVSTAATRLEPGGKIIVIMTRWHEDDLAGRLITEMVAGNGWKFLVINLPALAEEDDLLGRAPGEALWPERYPVEELERTKKALGSYVWNALYMGKPAARAGGYFDPANFNVVTDRAGHTVKAMRRWDLAASEAEGDYTAGVLLEKSSNGRWLVADVVRGQWSPAKVDEMVKATAEADGRTVPVVFEQERGAAGKLVVAHFKKMLPGFTVRGRLATGDKEVRAQPASAAVEAQTVDILKAKWNAEFLEECAVFPHGTNDDMVDAFCGAFGEMETKGGQVKSW